MARGRRGQVGWAVQPRRVAGGGLLALGEGGRALNDPVHGDHHHVAARGLWARFGHLIGSHDVGADRRRDRPPGCRYGGESHGA